MPAGYEGLHSDAKNFIPSFSSNRNTLKKSEGLQKGK